MAETAELRFPSLPKMNTLPLGVRRFEPRTTTQGAGVAAGDVERLALELGFARVGITHVAPLEAARRHLEVFLERGFAGEMRYLAQGRRDDPRELLPGAKSAIVAALAYGEREIVPRGASALTGEIARYARGRDYHQVMKTKLEDLAQGVAELSGRPCLGRASVDTAPLLERELARRAGLGFQGKSTMLIAPGLGSFILLGELLLDVAIEPALEPPARSEGCGSCRACLDACPSAAFTAPYVLDARRCVAYLTIEYGGTIPRELRRALGSRVYGCDVCQDVCPFNASEKPRPIAAELRAKHASLDLVALLNLGSAAYRKLARGTALRRAHRTTLQRNAAIALGNSGDPRAVPPLTRALLEHDKALVRAHCAWALGELRAHWDPSAREALEAASEGDPDPETREEARLALTLGR